MAAPSADLAVVIRDVVSLLIPIISDVTVDALRKIDRRRGRVWTRKWIRRRLRHGASDTLLRELALEDPDSYRNHLRMTPTKFDELLSLVEKNIAKQDTILRQAIPAKTKLEITIRYLATGDSFASLQYLYRIPKSTISKFIPKVLTAIYEVLEEYIKVPRTKEEWELVQRKFEVLWNFPNCVGAIDGKHVQIRCPAESGSNYYNYKGTFSIILFALVDAEYNFLYIDVGANGRANDGAVFQASTLNIALEGNSLNLPEKAVIVADDAFPLRKDILKPFSKRNLSISERVFNYRLSRARRVSENAFGILVSRFRIFERPIALLPETVDLVVKSACALHNWLRKSSGHHYLPPSSIDLEDHATCTVVPGTWRTTVNTSCIMSTSKLTTTNAYKRELKEHRESYEKYFISPQGSLPWQLKWVGAEKPSDTTSM